MRFVDSNILLYLLDRDTGEGSKYRRARDILKAEDVGLSVQVLQEFYTQATRETREGRISHERAAAYVGEFCEFPVQEMTVPLVKAAIATRHRFQISYWDAAIIEAARALGCSVVLSEDLGHGQNYGGVRVENPFLGY